MPARRDPRPTGGTEAPARPCYCADGCGREARCCLDATKPCADGTFGIFLPLCAPCATDLATLLARKGYDVKVRAYA